MNQKFDITVVVTRYKEPFDILKSCVDSLKRQTKCKIRILFLDQQEVPLTKKYINKLTDTSHSFVYENIPAKSLSFARNLGLNKAKTNYVAFCDVDAILDKNWAFEIVKTFKSTDAVIVGTKIVPVWNGKLSWYHKSKFIQEFFSLIDISNVIREVPKVFGASFAIDKSRLGKHRFSESLGRVGGKLLGGEETDLCQKLRDEKRKVVFTPFTSAGHQISPERLTLSWILKRAYYGGFSR